MPGFFILLLPKMRIVPQGAQVNTICRVWLLLVRGAGSAQAGKTLRSTEDSLGLPLGRNGHEHIRYEDPERLN